MADGSDIATQQELDSAKAILAHGEFPDWFIAGVTASLLPRLIAEVERLRAQAPAWRPIESAPKDGTWILIRHKNLWPGSPGFSVAQIHVEYSGPDDASERITWKNEAGYYQIAATHWQPLPEPPAGGGMCSPASGLGSSASDRSAT